MSKPWFRDTTMGEAPSPLAGVISQVLGSSSTRVVSDVVANGYATQSSPNIIH